MKKTTRALVGLVLIDGVLLAIAAWLVWLVRSGSVKTTVPPAEAISTITSYGGGLIGFVTVIMALACFNHRRNGN